MADVFPAQTWGGIRSSFYTELPANAAGFATTTALVFVFYKGEYVLANIAGRGWTIPGGRREPNEEPEQTAVREAYEETGAIIQNPLRIGCYLLSSTIRGVESSRLAPVYISQPERFVPLPAGSESLGVQLVSLERLQEVYYMWDPLIEGVCTYARERAKLQGWIL